MRSLKSRFVSTIAAATLLAASASWIAACGGDDPDPNGGTTGIETAGEWKTAAGATISIATDRWGAASIISYDNDKNEAITKVTAQSMTAKDKYGKVAWTDVASDSFYYCQVVADELSQIAVETSTITYDRSDPATKGCRGAAWSKLTK